MNNEKKSVISTPTFSLTASGFIVWIVFLVLKLCNMNNPDFAWLTWFWVWFPFWLPLAIDGFFIILYFVCLLIINKS